MAKPEQEERSPSEIESPYLTEEETAFYLKVSRPTLRKWRMKKYNPGLPFCKFGRTVRYRREDCDEFALKYRSV